MPSCKFKDLYHLATYTYLAILLHSAEHDNGPALILPDHLPEVIDCVLHWSLGSNVGSMLPVALHTDT